MPVAITIIVSLIGGGAAGAIINSVWNGFREKKRRRIDFNGAICELKAQVNKVENHTFQNWFSNMQVEVEKRCALVESAIRWRFRKHFVAARKKCAEPQTQNDLADPRPPFTGLSVGYDRLPEVTYQRGRINASDILDGLLSAAK